MSISPLVLASSNLHKVEEFDRLLAPLGLTVRPLSDWPELGEAPEDGDTFEANALQKARWAWERTGLWALADDSGLQVDALGGRPGVHSKRYTPEATASANNLKLLADLQGVQDRRARFVCVLALVGPGLAHTLRGQVEGSIALAPRGSYGFGYDPLFLPEETPGRTMAELSPAEKDRLSHRGRAAALLPGLLSPWMGAAE